MEDCAKVGGVFGSAILCDCLRFLRFWGVPTLQAVDIAGAGGCAIDAMGEKDCAGRWSGSVAIPFFCGCRVQLWVRLLSMSGFHAGAHHAFTMACKAPPVLTIGVHNETFL